jgi:steroid 5-alpha reductase family enzyme
MLQGVVVWLVSQPVLLVLVNPGDMLGWIDLLGFLLFTLGFFSEAISDWQLVRFKRHPGNSGRIITQGLWRLSRYPNYFGEAILWRGIFLIGFGSPTGIFGLISPLTINFLLLKVSGIPMLEEKYRGNPEFEAYRARTNAFFLWFPRRSQQHTARDSERG